MSAIPWLNPKGSCPHKGSTRVSGMGGIGLHDVPCTYTVCTVLLWHLSIDLSIYLSIYIYIQHVHTLRPAYILYGHIDPWTSKWQRQLKDDRETEGDSNCGK